MALFVEEYSRSGNGRKAALHAGWPAGEADRGREAMLRCPEVQARLAAQRDARFQAIEDEGARILDEAARVAFADLRRLFDAKGDFNGRAAAMRARFPPSSGGRCQDELLRGADIKAAIARHVRARFERIGLTPGKVLSEVECIAYGSLRRLYRPDGGHCGVNEIDDDTLNSIQWIDIDADRRTVLRWRRLDKVQALDLLGRHHRLWGRRKGLEMNEAGLLAAMAEGLARAP